jgi:hypothetical protein
MKKSPSLDLNLPNYTDNADIKDMSDNFKKIDRGVAATKESIPTIEETRIAIVNGGLAQFTWKQLRLAGFTWKMLRLNGFTWAGKCIDDCPRCLRRKCAKT